MQLTVREWMKDLIVFVDPDSTVYDALTLMRHRYVNSLIVSKTETNPQYGIVTSIDVCDKIVAQQRNPRTTKVRDIMNAPLITVNSGMGLSECAAKMKEHRIHHLPVVNNAGELVGMISATDFLVVAEAYGNDFEPRSLT